MSEKVSAHQNNFYASKFRDVMSEYIYEDEHCLFKLECGEGSNELKICKRYSNSEESERADQVRESCSQSASSGAASSGQRDSLSGVNSNQVSQEDLLSQISENDSSSREESSEKQNSEESEPLEKLNGYRHLYDDLVQTGFLQHPWIQQYLEVAKSTLREVLLCPSLEFKQVMKFWCFTNKIPFQSDVRYFHYLAEDQFIIEHNLKRIKSNMISNLKSTFIMLGETKQNYHHNKKIITSLGITSPQQAKERLILWLTNLHCKIYIHESLLFPSLEPKKIQINGQIPIHFLESENLLFPIKISIFNLQRLEKFYQKDVSQRADMDVVQKYWYWSIKKNLSNLRKFTTHAKFTLDCFQEDNKSNVNRKFTLDCLQEDNKSKKVKKQIKMNDQDNDKDGEKYNRKDQAYLDGYLE